jgi:hypothetical protein
MCKRYGFAVLILLFPPLIMSVVKLVSLELLPKAEVVELRPSCFFRGFDELDAKGVVKTDGTEVPEACRSVRPPAKKQQAASDRATKPGNEKQGSDPAATTPAPGAGAGTPSPGAGTPAPGATTGAPATGATAGTPGPAAGDDKAPRGIGQTLTQFRATEIKARAEFATASAILQAAAIAAFIFAIFRLVSTWRDLNAPPVEPAPAPAQLPAQPQPAEPQRNPAEPGDSRFLLATAVLSFLIAAFLAYSDTGSTTFDNVLMNVIFENGVQAKIFVAATFEKFQNIVLTKSLFGETTFAPYRAIVFANLLSAYLAGGLLLVYLAVLAIPADSIGSAKDRVSGLQIVVVIGSIIFTLSAVANRAAAAWATVGLDEGSGKALIEVANSIPKLWDYASTVFLIAAVATGYAGIRASKEPAARKDGAGKDEKETKEQKDSATALRTPDGEDFKAFGWVVQFIIALAPVWLPASIGTFIKALPTPP